MSNPPERKPPQEQKVSPVSAPGFLHRPPVPPAPAQQKEEKPDVSPVSVPPLRPRMGSGGAK